MPEDGEEPTLFHDIAKKLEQFCSAREAERVMLDGLVTPNPQLQGPLLPNQLQFSMRRLDGKLTGDLFRDQREFFQKRDLLTGGYVHWQPRFPWPDNTIIRTVCWVPPPHYQPVIHRCIAYGAATYWSQVRAWFLIKASLELPETVDDPPVTEVPTNNKEWFNATMKLVKRDRYILRGQPVPSDKKPASQQLARRHEKERKALRLPPLSAKSIETNHGYLRLMPWPPW